MNSEFQEDRLATVWLRRLSYLEVTLFAMFSPLSSLGQHASGKKIYTCSCAYNKLMTKIKKHRPAAVWLQILSYLDGTQFAMSFGLSVLGKLSS